MNPAALARRGTAVLALHYQNEVLHEDGRIRVGLAPGDPRRTAVIAGAARMLAWGRAHELPLVFVRIAFRHGHVDVIRNCKVFRDVVRLDAAVDGTWGAEFLPALVPRELAPREFTINHQRVSAFHGTPLRDLLDALRVQRLVVGGVSTHSVVATSVAAAADAGYELTVVADACASADPALHDYALRSMELVAEVCSMDRLEGLPAAGEGHD
jgi:nicotinamidase-related amidase